MIIAVCGAQRGVGTTQFCIMLARYYELAKNKKTVIIDLSESLELYRNNKLASNREKLCTKVLGGEDALDLALEEDYEYLILDLGADFIKHKRDFYYSYTKIILASLKPWKVDTFSRFLGAHIPESMRCGEVLFIANSAADKAIADFEKRENIRIIPMPHLENPMRIDRESYGFLQGIL